MSRNYFINQRVGTMATALLFFSRTLLTNNSQLFFLTDTHESLNLNWRPYMSAHVVLVINNFY